MTKEIIIDGINVSECVSFDKLNGLNICCYDDTREDKIPFANFCVENKDCYFKQLKRAEQKLKGIKEIVVPIKENTCFGRHCGAIDWILQTIEGKGENNG